MKGVASANPGMGPSDPGSVRSSSTGSGRSQFETRRQHTPVASWNTGSPEEG